MTKKYLIVNAYDFGLAHGVNQGIIEAYEHSIVTSAGQPPWGLPLFSTSIAENIN